MQATPLPEVWLRGPLPAIPSLLQPVAHALLQALEEISVLMDGFPSERLWDSPAGVASPGFHLQHLTGVLDRLFTYARGESLNAAQLEWLSREGVPYATPDKGSAVRQLIDRFGAQVDQALAQLTITPEQVLKEPRGVGRAQIPSTVLGLLVHAAEHTQRHVGQLIVTVRILSFSSK